MSRKTDPSENHEHPDGAIVNVARKVEASFDKAKHAVSKVGEKSFTDCVQGCKGYVHDNPGKSLLIAAGVGAAVALLLRRR
jgi:ElaB/YqjD/DUF883 family membrane-anchored ribosome-binding protein